jgi:hypothetical protein
MSGAQRSSYAQRERMSSMGLGAIGEEVASRPPCVLTRVKRQGHRYRFRTTVLVHSDRSLVAGHREQRVDRR